MRAFAFGLATMSMAVSAEVLGIHHDHIGGIVFREQGFKYFLEVLPNLVEGIKELLVGGGFHFLDGLHQAFPCRYQVVFVRG